MSITWQTPRVLVERPSQSPDAIRRAFVANAMWMLGTSAADPETRKAFESSLGPCMEYQGKPVPWPLDVPFAILPDGKVQGISTCGLIAEDVWRKMGVGMTALYRAYVPSTSISRSRNYAIGIGAWRHAISGKLPEPGDMIVIGTGTSTHACTLLWWESDAAGRIAVTCDGGQVDKARGYLQCCKLVRRRLKTGPLRLGTRPVNGFADCTHLGFIGPTIEVPKGWTLIPLNERVAFRKGVLPFKAGTPLA